MKTSTFILLFVISMWVAASAQPKSPAGDMAKTVVTIWKDSLSVHPGPPVKYDYNMSEKVVVNDPKGVDAFIQASNEMEMLPSLNYAKGKTVLLDYYFNRETRMEAGKAIRFHYLWEEYDNNGYSILGNVFNKYGIRTSALEAAPTPENLKDASIYIIVDPDTEKETKSPNYIQPKDIDVIYNWVKAGGVLMLFGNDSGNAELNHFNQLTAKFGVQFNEDSRNRVLGNQFEMGAIKIKPGNPIFKTAAKVYIKEYASQKLSGDAKAVLTEGNNIVVSVAKVGKGTVFAVGDPWFYNEYTDGRKLPKDFENYKAAEDVVKWVIQQIK